MHKKLALVGVVLVMILAGLGVGIHIHTHKNSPAPILDTHSTVVVKKTTYQATVSNGVFVTKSSSSLGRYVTTPDGKPLYTYSNDSKGVSNCTGSCVASWRPYADTAAPGTGLPANVGTITRTDDDTVQYTYKGLPLYTYAQDQSGKVLGNNKEGFKLAQL